MDTRVTATGLLQETIQAATQELDRILNRMLRADPVLRLERESASNWIVVDAANQDAVMLRTPSVKTCGRFMLAFCAKHPEARFIDGEFEARARSGEPMRGSELPPAGKGAADHPSVPQTVVPEGDEFASPGVPVPPMTFEEAFALETQRLLAIASQDAYSLKVPDAPMAEVIPIREGIA
jgi:hypothetical protein